MSSWPEGVSDGLALPCSECGVAPQFDWKCDDHLWREIVPKEVSRDVICLPCFARMAETHDADAAICLRQIQFIGPGYTVVFNAAAAIDHASGQVRVSG